MKLFLHQLAMWIVLILTSVLIPMINVPVEFGGPEFKFYVEFASRAFLLVGFAVYYRCFLEWIGVIKKVEV